VDRGSGAHVGLDVTGMARACSALVNSPHNITSQCPKLAVIAMRPGLELLISRAPVRRLGYPPASTMDGIRGHPRRSAGLACFSELTRSLGLRRADLAEMDLTVVIYVDHAYP
jgi:hypothetical protein